MSDGEVLSIGRRRLRFVTVPLVHWPESMWTYEETQHILFSNDGFGQHLASERLWDDEHSLDELMRANRCVCVTRRERRCGVKWCGQEIFRVDASCHVMSTLIASVIAILLFLSSFFFST